MSQSVVSVTEVEPTEVHAPTALFSQAQLERHAAALAVSHQVAVDRRRGRPLLPRLDKCATKLEDAYQLFSTVARADPQPVGSEEWIRDNYHVVLDQTREVRQDLPKTFYFELPKLAAGPGAGYPRVYDVASELVGHTAGRLDVETLVDFVAAYQRASPLSIGETWAIPIMLRVSLVEELARLVDGVIAARRSREQARRWEATIAEEHSDLEAEFDRLLRTEKQPSGHLPAALVVELLQWLRDQPPSAAPAWLALHRALEAQGDTPEELLRSEHQREATDQLAIGNVIGSMRLLSSVDWPLFFDRVSVVEQILRGDPVQAYAQMDFQTRDRYRHSVEKLAKRSRESEIEVAKRAIALAVAAQQRDPQNDRPHHVGYFLVSRGRFTLERELHYPASVRERLARFVFTHPALGYLGLISVTTALGVASLLAYAGRQDASPGLIVLVALVTLIPVSELSISLINLLLTSQIRPRPLPKLDMRSGIPATARTIVVVPAIIDSEPRVETLLHDLEVRFLANRDRHLHFALLSDWPDAASASLPEDQPIVEAALRGIDQLNERHGNDRFFLFHRSRRWNERDQRWMGWERKRGKLAEFNRLLRGATDTSFSVRHGDLSLLPSIRFAITLDSDTRLPMEAGRRLVGTLAHPLNRPRFDARLGRVTEGYGILQPRVQVSVESATRTAFAQVFAGHVGLDPYTTAVSDVYQDLFHEGSFVGKGIYDVDAFLAALAGRVPEHTLLSHDLFEGFYARAGLCTDIELVDDYPSNYLAFAARMHRWVRGDWQIARWLARTVPSESGVVVRNTLPVISRWKILDNLRRSLIAPALVALLVAGWTVLPGSALLWSGLALLVLAFPAYVQVGRSLGSRFRGVPLREHFLAERDNLATSARQAFLSTVFLLHQSGVMLDAIGRTLFRLLVSRRRLLEWVTADRSAHVEASASDVSRQMPGTLITPALIAIALGLVAPVRLPLAAPILVLWCLSPAIAYATGRPLKRYVASLSRAERAAFRRTARKIWRFFEEFVGPDDHWLVPDNIQENRRDLVAHRTSPTNIGLQLLSTLAAHDFGYITLDGLLNRLEPTFATLLRMQRYRGHFYNWYDTRTLAALSPAYISTVDSGNLAGHLVTLRTALTELTEGIPIISASFLHALDDLADLVDVELAHSADGDAARLKPFLKELGRFRAQLTTPPTTIDQWMVRLPQIRDRLSVLGVLLHEIEEPLLASSPKSSIAEATIWLDRAAATVADRMESLDRLLGWTLEVDVSRAVVSLPAPVPSVAELIVWCDRFLEHEPTGHLRPAVEESKRQAFELIERSERLGIFADDLVEETEFDFLFDPERQLFTIGFNVSEGRLDNSYYDTLASEARLASFLAIATGKISRDHWFKLGRSLTPSGQSRALLSWSASMFEYLMPVLIMRAYPGTLLDETYRAVVERQIQYATGRGTPWGISESAYYAQDLDGNYQYRAFGVPGLGLKRGLADDLVIAPYASILAASIAPAAVHDNLERLTAEGMAGRYGYYEAIDYTADRLPKGHVGGIPLLTYMAHHQGMSLLALDNAVNAAPMQDRFHADRRVQAAELLLQERLPNLVPFKNPPLEKADHLPSSRRSTRVSARRYATPHTLSPRTHLLSNGSYGVMVTNAGGGFSRRQGVALTRWREDITADAWGSFIYLRDLDSREVWSTTYQPTLREPEEYEVTFAPDRASWRRVDDGIEARTEVVVSPEDDAELRRVSLTNHSDRVRSIEITSYVEVVLAPADADLVHPAFSNLFVETTALPDRDALICTRRPRTGTEHLYLFHVISGRGRLGGATEYETDRARFVGRGRTLERPQALYRTAPLSNTTGAVLDPIVSLRQTVRIPPGGTARLAFTTGFATNADVARQLVEKYHDRRAVARSLALASTHSQIEMRHLGLSIDETMLFDRLAGRLIYGDPRLRSAEAIRANGLSQSELWKYGISGDLPILLVRLKDDASVPLFRELVKAHEYLRLRGFAFDLVALNEHASSYLQDLHHALMQIVESSPEQPWLDRPGGVFVRRADLMSGDDQTLLRAAARAIMDAADLGLDEQLKRTNIPSVEAERRAEFPGADSAPYTDAGVSVPADLELFNGSGGFSDRGREYTVIVDLDKANLPPASWSNVVANASFGFVASECGPGCTWSVNSHDNRLSPWNNDPVSDTPGEAMFVRDEETGRFWSATPLPSGQGGRYLVRHGAGYSAYEHRRHALTSTLLLFVPTVDPVKVFQLTLENNSKRRRRVTITLYVDWVLGENQSRSHLHVVTSRDPVTGAVLARNAFRQDFGHRVAFLDLYPGTERTVTGDRAEFMGRNGKLRAPAALRRRSLSDRTGAGLDPCGAVQVSVVLDPGQTCTVIGLLGDAPDEAAARALVQRYRETATVDAALREARAFWDDLLGTLTVSTPDRAMDLMVNRWLPYQTLACRIWGRTAFYQSSGAFGFRDQLQDVLALVGAQPALVRAHILHAASRQFVEGDVQHWWHEPGGQGVRTRFADDRLWLVYATVHYLSATGDRSLLDEPVSFLEMRALNPGEHEAYERPSVSRQVAPLYEHCVRAIALNLESGAHGLPLIGGGDWNDGMNLIGVEGRGESVWLGWFLLHILRGFAPIAAARGEDDRATQYLRFADRLLAAIEEAWDGAWYRRAYFDDGTPLGSKVNEECRIDAIAQSWAVIAGGGDPARARQAMASLDEQLVRPKDGIVLLLTPPFDHMVPSPGYIQGYVPGVRENGGQYTHAALWTVLAHAELGDGDRAAELFALLNPINHARTAAEVARYRAEPYVVAADVYSRPPHTGRAGWTWYTGSSGWMYRVGMEAILGLTLKENALHIDPCIPHNWPRFDAVLKRAGAEWRIAVENPGGVNRGVRSIELDGVDHTGRDIPLAGITGAHAVRVVLG